MLDVAHLRLKVFFSAFISICANNGFYYDIFIDVYIYFNDVHTVNFFSPLIANNFLLSSKPLSTLMSFFFYDAPLSLGLLKET